MGALIRARDWSTTSLGPAHGWPHDLKTAISIMLNSRYPMFVWWGAELIKFYNDSYIPMLGSRHPDALGRPASDVWADIWNVVGPQADIVLRDGRATWNEEVLLVMERNNFVEETYFSWSYSPIADGNGTVRGVFCAVTEDTPKVVSRRRMKTLRDLGERALAAARSVEHACHAAADTLADNPRDVPFAVLYLLDPEGKEAIRREVVGLGASSPAAPDHVSINAASDVWNFGAVLARGETRTVEHLEDTFGRLTGGAWPDDAIQRAVVLPLARTGTRESPAGFLVAGVSPRLSFDDDYRGFLNLVAGHIATTIDNARAYEDEQQRTEALAEIDRAKTLFFSNVSHEFRTPLTLMLGPLEDLLARGPSDVSESARGELDIVHRNGLRLLKLVNTLLDFSRIEAGRAQATYEPTALGPYTAELASTFRSACERAGLRLFVECPDLPDPVYVDRGMWEQIVLNLVSNAFKYTLDGEIRVSVRAAADGARVTMADTGTGIPVDAVPRLFERFYRVPNANGRTHEGTGIGLAFVQELVRLHGGSVTVDSALGHGSTFTVTVPFGAHHLPADRIRTPQVLLSTPTGARPYVEAALHWLPAETSRASLPGGDVSTADRRSVIEACDGVVPARKPRILVADDNADMRDYVRRLLADHFDVDVVADGDQAMAAVASRRPDLVLADVMMPRRDGFGLLGALRADQSTATIPIMLLSARAGEESRVEGLQAGADDYLVKPFSSRELLARINANLQLARLRERVFRRERGALAAIEAIEAQRGRISRELHDEMGQDLTALVLGLRGVLDTVSTYSSVHHRVQGLHDIVNGMSRNMHRIVLELRPGAFDDQGLQAALSSYAEDWSRRYDVDVKFDTVGNPPGRLSSHVETTIYRIVQEALTNVSKHARATTVSVILQYGSREVVAIVEDNGCGFDTTGSASARAGGGLGLVGMTERAALVGGTCQVESRSGSTTVIARIPTIAVEHSSHV